MGVLTMLKGLPLSYNRDLQEDKQALFDAVDTVESSVEILTEVVKGLSVNRDILERAVDSGGLLATELADYLVTKGIPFRETHAIVGRIVRDCLQNGREITALSWKELQHFCDLFGPDVSERLSVRGAIDRKRQIGGTAKKSVEARLAIWEKRLRE